MAIFCPKINRPDGTRVVWTMLCPKVNRPDGAQAYTLVVFSVP